MSAPALGGLGQQPLGWHHGEVACERSHDCPPVSRWAGRLRTGGFDSGKTSPTAKKTSNPVGRSSESARVVTQQGLPPSLSLPPAAAARPVRSRSGIFIKAEETWDAIDEQNSLGQIAKDFQMDFTRGKQKFWKDFHLANNRAQSTQSSSPVFSLRRSSIGSTDFVPDVEMFEEQTVRLKDAASDIKERHQAFQPMTAQERERAVLFARRPTIRSNAPEISELVSDEEQFAWRDKLEAWKYVRRIEPELPPLVPIPIPLEQEVHSQTMVKFNARPDVLQRHSPEARSEWMAQRSINREAHHCVVSMVRNQRRADFKKKRQADALKVAFRTPVLEEVVEEAPYPAEARWFEFLLVTAFSVTIQEQLSLRKMSKQERAQYLEIHGERLNKSTGKGGYLIQALLLNVALKDPVTHQRMNMLSCMFSRKFHVRQEQRRVKTIWKCMQKWTGGVMVMYLRRYVRRIVNLQRWWRERCKPRLDQIIDKFTIRWLRIEKEMIVKDLKRRDSVDARYAQAHVNSLTYEEYTSMLRAQTLPMEDRVQPLLVDENVRTTFIANELRARRYFLLSLIKVWEDDLRAWKRAVAGSGATEPVFKFPPRRPSYLPPEFGAGREAGELEVKQMVISAKANPRGGGWTQIPQKVNGKYVSIASARSSDGDYATVDEEDLEHFGVSSSIFP